MKNQGKTGIIREFCIIFIQVKEKLGITDYLVHILFLSSPCVVERKVVVLFALSKPELHHFR